MTQVRSTSEPAAATLVGALAAFPLLEVLDLLARTGRTGELQVVGPGLDRRIWVDRGDLVDAGTTGITGMFELARSEDGWFYFTLFDGVPEGSGRMALSSVIESLTPQIAEWRTLVAHFPVDAVVRMAAATPADEVQIRADQWQLLSLVGAGREVRDVLVSSPQHPLDTLRTLQELTNGHLVVVEPAIPAGGYEPETPAPEPEQSLPGLSTAVADDEDHADTDTAAPPTTTEEPAPAPSEAPAPAERIQGSVMPPPISGDPWSTPPFPSAEHAVDERT